MYSTDRISDTLSTAMNRRSILKKTLVGAGAAALAVRTVGPAFANHTSQTYTVSANANFRSGPGTSYSIISVIYKGATFQINGQVQNGYAGIIYNGKSGWVLASLVVAAGGSSTPVISGIGWTTSAVNLRSGPGSSYAVLRVVPYAAQVGTSTTVTNGYRYVTHNGLAGWMASAYISTTNPDDQGGNYATTTANVNFRTEPSTSSAIIQVIPAGARVQVLHTQAGDFINVNYNNKQGWVHKAYLKF
jgi:zinc D-Ala-D-Ala carboxypeptidase